MMQCFEWYLPENGLHWKRLTDQARSLRKAGINMVWLPPAYKGAAGSASVGYDVYDMYDLGEFDQKGSVRTKYGTKDEYLAAVQALQQNGIAVLCDVVLNHRMGADGTERVTVTEGHSANRNQDISGKQQITAWTKFDFPGREGVHSGFCWNAAHFSGTDWDEGAKRNGIFRFEGKCWNRETDAENGNYDYLMGADLDTDCPEVILETRNWGSWYQDTVHMDGFRLDAVKHIGFDFIREWLHSMRERNPRSELFTVGEYWSKDVGRLSHYLDVTQHTLSLFDVPLHFRFLEAATSNGYFDMAQIYDYTLAGVDPEHAVTFVDNHDTHPGQALCSFIPAWFKPIAYALILLRAVGTPCVFYGDYYGIPHNNIEPVEELKTIMLLRKEKSYGEQHTYLDNPNYIGWTRQGDNEYIKSGLAVVISNSNDGEKRMYIGKENAGEEFIDALGNCEEEIIVDEEGYGNFKVKGKSCSIWIKG